MAIHHSQVYIDSAKTKVNLNKRLEDIGWGLFLFMIGVLLLLPSELVSQGAWLIGAGLIMLGLNAIRYLNHISISWVTVTLGFVAMLVGLASFFGLRLPLFAILLAAAGAGIIIKSLFGTRN
jgi:predicted permease